MNLKLSALLTTATLFWIGASATVHASVTKLCDASIESVAQTTSVPKEVLYKIVRLESGRRVKGEHISWPWSLNNAGKGYFLETKTEALNKLGDLIALGKKNIDVGCMQLNLRWHSRYFDSLEEMVSPAENVSYAAKFLEQLYKETGSWEKAVRFYHSRNSKHNEIYYAKYQKMPIPEGLQRAEIVSAPQIAKLASEVVKPTDAVNSSLFWLTPKGSMIDFVPNSGGGPAFADLRDFKVPPLFKM